MKKIVNYIYLILWLFPLYFFIRDFFETDEFLTTINMDILKVLFFSLKQGLYSTILSFLIAVIPGYYLAYNRNFLSKVLENTIFIPFFFPVISLITVFSILFNLPIIEKLNILYTLKGILLANVFYNTPIFVKYIGTGLRQIPQNIEEAMELDGANWWTLLFRTQFVMMLPQIFRAFILVFTYCFLNFGIIVGLGGIYYSTIETEIASTLFGTMDFTRALVLGGVQFLVLLMINGVGKFIVEYEIYDNNIPVKKSNILTTLYTFIFCIFEYGVIILGILLSFINIFNGEFSLKGYYNLFSKNFLENYHIIESIINSVVVALVVSLITIIITYIIIKNYSILTDIIIFANLGISGVFLAITLYYLNVLFDIPLFILLSFGYIITTIPIAYSFMYQYVKKFPKDIIEISQLDCDNIIQRFIFVELPNLKNIFIATGLQIFAIILGEFTLGYTMQLGDIFPLISTTNYNLLVEKRYLESSAFSSLVLFIVFCTFLLGENIKKKMRD